MSRPQPDLLLLHEIFRAARNNLSNETWDYLVGGAETETTLKRNRQALDSLAFRPRVLRDVSGVDCSTELLGQRLRIPVFLAPIGSLQDLHRDAGAAAARAARQFGTLTMLSSSSAPGLEATAAAADGAKIFQLYVRGDRDYVDDHFRRAIDAGYIAVCLTVDLDRYGRRERDLSRRYVTTARQGVTGDEHQVRFSWDDVKRIKDTYAVPLILKGIATAEDAAIAVEHGVEGIYVSNHGGRQLDHGRGCIEILREVVTAVAARASVLVDGGFLRGTDIVKAMALGADAVGVGRLFGYGIAAAGEHGVERVLEILETEIVIALGL
ncbi:MAG: alpha-hydroxy-acid oxidizing protein, partial [Gammaproteobacteria bacterium]|nr:alpha-hydroxy-acid oxidizing protein [Gammaproteobacteria bacterium]